MPTVGLERDELFKRLGRTYTQEEFEDLCFDFGVELDDVTSEVEERAKQGQSTEGASDVVLYRIDIPANRYDLLCMEGFVQALRVFLNMDEPPVYTTVSSGLTITVPAPVEIRPFVVGAVLRDIAFDEISYKSFIDLQEKLHANICRGRTLVSIGTHDLDSIEPPFTYQARKPEEIRFVPLRDEKEFNGVELMEHLETDLALRSYLPIIRSSPVYPVIYDNKEQVCSLPPIINGRLSKISTNTKNVFIEVTATDLTKAKITLNTMCAMFGQYTKNKFEIQTVDIVDHTGKVVMTSPDVSPVETKAKVEYINKMLGLSLSPKDIIPLLKKMLLPCSLSADETELVVLAPITRSDVLHACDVAEDVGIAYGFNNLTKSLPDCATVGGWQPVNRLTELLRCELAGAGFCEVLTLTLCSTAEAFDHLRLKDDGKTAVSLSNPKTIEYQVVRTSLIPGLLKCLRENRGEPLPQKIFEIADVVHQDNESDVGATNTRELCVVYTGLTAGFEIVHGVLDHIVMLLACGSYKFEPCDHPTYLPGRVANIVIDGKQRGRIGVLHPTVGANFELTLPATVLTLSVDPFV